MPIGQTVVIETVAGSGGTIGIGQWDTHVGAIIFPINYDLEKDSRRSGGCAAYSVRNIKVN